MRTLVKSESFDLYEPQELTEEIAENASFVIFNGERETEIEVDEISALRDGRIYLSSFAKGVVKWKEDQRQYVLCFYSTQTPLGQLSCVGVPSPQTSPGTDLGKENVD